MRNFYPGLPFHAMGEYELGADLCITAGMALVSSCQMHLGVNMAQAATWLIRVKSQRVFQLMKIKRGTTGSFCFCSSENSSDSVFTLTQCISSARS